jgi:hypothetical protein
MEIEKIPLKFHIEDNKLILDDTCLILNEDELVLDYIIEEGVVHYTHMAIKRKIPVSIGPHRGWMELTKIEIKEEK